MPLTDKGNKIMANMKSEYGPDKGERVFYASRNKGTITGVDPESSRGNKRAGEAVKQGFSSLIKKSKSLRR